MNTPTLPHVSLPQVDVHDVADRAGDLGELVTGALSTGLDKAQDLASAAIDVFEEIPDKALSLAGAVIPALRPAARRTIRPWMIVVAVLASFAVVAWVLKRRRTSSEPVALPPASTPPTSSVSEAS